MQPLISVIVPIYNVAPYLEKCVMTVVNQTYKNIEIILVDDGSTDGSDIICDDLSSKYRNIIVIHQKNKGLAEARNIALENIKGEWVAFLDSDDWIETDMYEILLSAARENNVDIAACKTRNCFMGNKTSVYDDSEEISIFSIEEIIHDLAFGNRIRFEVWNKIWRRDLIGTTRFIPNQVSEDIYFDRILFTKARKICFVDKTLHNYLIQRPGNTNSSFKINRLCMYKELSKFYDKLIQENHTKSAKEIAYITASYSVTFYEQAMISNENKSIKKKIFKEFKKAYYKSMPIPLKLKKQSIVLILFFLFPNRLCNMKSKRKKMEKNNDK